MGTFAAVSVPVEERERLGKLVETTKAVFDDLNSKLSTYREDSEISRLNRAAGAEPLEVSDATMDVLRASRDYARLTGGAFDPTLAPLIFLWGFSGGTAPTKLLDRDTVKEGLRLVGMERVKLEGRTAFLGLSGMALDLGGIAKGYAVDAAYERLEAAGARSFLIDLGGNMRGRGTARGARPWTVGVRDPFERGGLLGTVQLTDGLAVATSGNYEQYVYIEGKPYTHIIDPRTGYPTRGMAGVTVIGDSATEVDALSTALFILGPEEGMRILDGRKSHALFVPDRRPIEILVTPGFRERFVPFEEFAGAVRTIQKDP